MDISNLKLIGCDGTAVNMVHKSRVIKILETRQKKKPFTMDNLLTACKWASF